MPARACVATGQVFLAILLTIVLVTKVIGVEKVRLTLPLVRRVIGTLHCYVPTSPYGTYSKQGELSSGSREPESRCGPCSGNTLGNLDPILGQRVKNTFELICDITNKPDLDTTVTARSRGPRRSKPLTALDSASKIHSN
ncbi:hypothetical protein Fcan01_09029 [Folsomia candida]|uniref:Uncharacterized protein n=1 Tax=Folsomia candida TaxID=158441 RepID=A0A226EEH5_FOLCA|nr:hypothetical protein Fcan01_09029 [Folsomia candida]